MLIESLENRFFLSNADIVIVLLDTGIDFMNEKLTSILWENPNEIFGDEIDNDDNGFIDDTYGWDFLENDGFPQDELGHGTTVASVLFDELSDTNIKLFPVRAIGGQREELDAALDYIVGLSERYEEIKVVNNSWVVSQMPDELEHSISMLRDNDVAFVVAAGNNGRDLDLFDKNSPFGVLPSKLELNNIFSVAALSQDKNNLAGFSNYGYETVDLAAPGSLIHAISLDNRDALVSGTSYAAPYVSASIAKMYSLNPMIQLDDIRNALLSSVDDKDFLDGKVNSGGTLNSDRSLEKSGPVSIISFSPYPQDMLTTNTIVWELHYSDKNSLENRIVIDWGDGTVTDFIKGNIDFQEIFLNISHEYSKGGTFHVSVNVFDQTSADGISFDIDIFDPVAAWYSYYDIVEDNFFVFYSFDYPTWQ